MTDTLTEFINATKGLSDLQAGVTIVANGATEQAVVRDILVSNPGAAPLRLKSGVSILATIAGSTALTGAEIVGASASMTIDTALVAVLNRLAFFPATGTTAATLTLPTRYSGGFVAAGTATLTQITVPAPDNNVCNFACVSAAGDVYYAANLAAYPQLYKRAGGPGGTQTTVDAAFGQAICWDGSHTIYGITGTTLKILDTTTGVVTSKAITGGPGAIDAYGHISAVDGYILMRPVYSPGTLYLVSAATGAATSLGVAGPLNPTRLFLALTKTSAGRYIALMPATNSAVYWWDLGTSLAAPVVGSSGTISVAASMSTISANWNGLLQPATGTDIALLVDTSATSARLIVIDLVAKETLSETAASVATVSGVIPYPLPIDAAAASADFGAVTIRATGIKTT